MRYNTLYTLTDHEKIVLFHENILNREHYLKQSNLPLRNQHVHKKSKNYWKIKDFFWTSHMFKI